MKKVLSLVVVLTMLLGLMLPTGAVFANVEMKSYSVLFTESSLPATLEQDLEAMGAELVQSVPQIGFAQVRAPKSSIKALKGLAGVQVVNPSIKWALPQAERIQVTETAKEMTDGAYFWDRQWDIQRITENGASYELGKGSHDVVIGVVDTGIDPDHADLVGNLLPGSKNFVPAGGYAGEEPYETGDINAVNDLHGHGTHVAGSIAANGGMLGVAPEIGFRAYRVFGKGSAESAWIINAMIAAADDGVDVLSMSLGGFDLLGQTFYTDPETGEVEKLGNDVADFTAYKRAVQYVQQKDIVIVVAAGNDGIDCTNKSEVTAFLNAEYGEDGYEFRGAGFNVPAIYPNIVTVSATGPNDILALYSNFGAGFIDIAAPGGDYRVYMEHKANGTFDEYLVQKLYYNEFCFSTGEDGGYYYSVGTSMSAPKVSAVAGLLIDKYPDLPAKEIAKMLKTNGVDSVNGNEKKIFGNGHLNAVKALQ